MSDKPAGHELSGVISDRIRSGEIEGGQHKVDRGTVQPDPAAVKGSEGHSITGRGNK